MPHVEKNNDSRMKNRCQSWDYSQPGTYMITITLKNRSKNILGTLTNCELLHDRRVAYNKVPPETILAETSKTTVHLTELGEQISKQWYQLSSKYKEVKVLNCKVMPDHFHGIIWVMQPMPIHLGEIIRAFKAATTRTYREITGTEAPLWSEGFVDTILRSPHSLERAKEYIVENPRRLAIKLLLPNLFKNISKIEVKNLFPSYPKFAAEFSLIGNRYLLDKPTFFQVQCSRNDFEYQKNEKGESIKKLPPKIQTRDFLEKQTTMLEAGHKGAVIVSPCISDGEKALARIACTQGFPLIVLCKMGFREKFKPSGELYDLCASGKLLMLAPIAWKHTLKRVFITREKAQILNRIAQLICNNRWSETEYKRSPLLIDDSSCMEACKK